MAARKTTTKAPAKKRAPRKRAPVAKKPTVAEVLAHDMQRSVARSIMLASLFAFNAIVVGALVWFQLTSYTHQQERIARLASAVSTVNVAASSRLSSLEARVDALEPLTSDRWRRAHMIKFCLEAEQLNAKWVCPSPLKIAPDRPQEIAPGSTNGLRPFAPASVFINP